ncbi:hypothetical protein EWM64_g10628 [Hericium alpestre]|uniref:lytic cellulose monooxygenase (C4-dehydrogenating) n=1 Tax=Hericium alpestre TaxID=135208 RepID=A0A4Y9ZG36_9AGAM|nr:hypothetical protein EWM64_g10628 [Hericium alpestre]
MEAIALHVAQTFGGAQFYLSCGQINVTGGGSGTPGPLVAIPGVYTGYEPGILININYPIPANYTQPGPFLPYLMTIAFEHLEQAMTVKRRLIIVRDKTLVCECTGHVNRNKHTLEKILNGTFAGKTNKEWICRLLLCVTAVILADFLIFVCFHPITHRLRRSRVFIEHTIHETAGLEHGLNIAGYAILRPTARDSLLRAVDQRER